MPALEVETALPAGDAPASASAGAAAPPAELLRELETLVRSNTRRWKRLILLEMVAAPLAYLWVVFSLDILVHLPRWGRVTTQWRGQYGPGGQGDGRV